MGSLFRSEEMELYQLILHTDTSYECISKLGELGVVEFRDLNANLSLFQRKFGDKVCQCDEMERKLRYIHMEIQNDGIPIDDIATETPQKREWNELVTQINQLELELRAVTKNAKELKCNYLKLTELKHILRKIHELNDKFDNDGGGGGGSSSNINDDIDFKYESKPILFGLCAGVISNDRLLSFERMLHRTLHGNNLYYHQTIHIHPMEDYQTGTITNKSVFIAFCHGDEIQQRIQKICTGYHTILHALPVGRVLRKKMAINLMKRIIDLNVVQQQTHAHRHRLLIAAAKSFNEWSIKLCKIKAIYHTINKFNADMMKNFLIAECWIAAHDIQKVQSVLLQATKASATTTEQSEPIVVPILNRLQTFNLASPSPPSPPTYFITNKFTNAFHGLIERYGVADYREMNPTPFTCVSIPFLFAIMFGDMGHGILMTIFALWMILWEKSLVKRKNTANNEVSHH